MIRHTVLFRFTNPTDAHRAKEKLESLVGVVPSIVSLWAGISTGAESDTHQLALITEHDSQQGLDEYQQHPSHREVSGWIRERMSDKATVDAEV